MKRILASLLVLSLFSLGSVGCSDMSSTKSETKPSTPAGTTTVTSEKEVKKTGDTNLTTGASNRQQPSTPQNQPTDESKQIDRK
jgi:hypothetical protein